MKVFVTGVNGQLGYDVLRELVKRGYECIGSDITPEYSGIADASAIKRYGQLDITDEIAVGSTIRALHPDAVVHCAAWTAVDMAEDDANVTNVRRVNVDGTKNIAEACKAIDAKMLYISTDYVFDGTGIEPWKPDNKCFNPINVYGQSKLDGEQAVSDILERYFIVRIAWAFGINGNNFVKTMLRLGKTHNQIKVVNDQIGTPTYTRDLSRLLVDMIETDKYGYYHATNEGGYISWYDFACEIFRQAGLNTRVVPVTTDEYRMNKAARPMNSRLDQSKLVEADLLPMPDWKTSLSRYLKEAGDVI